MKKRVFLFLHLFVMSVVWTSAIAQPEQNTFSITPRIGISATNMIDDPTIEMPFVYARHTGPVNGRFTGLTTRTLYNTNYRMAFAGSVDMQWTLNQRWAIVTGLGYSLRGCKYEDEYNPQVSSFELVGWSVKDVRINMHYINVPVMAKLYIGKGFALNTGMQLDWLVRSNYRSRLGYIASADGEYSIGLINDSWTVNMDAEKLYEKDVIIKVNKNYKTFDMSIPLGFSYEYRHFVTDLRAYFGLADVTDGQGRCKNIGFTLSFGYRFDFKIKSAF